MKQLQEHEISVAIIALPAELARHAVMLVESSTTVLLCTETPATICFKAICQSQHIIQQARVGHDAVLLHVILPHHMLKPGQPLLHVR